MAKRSSASSKATHSPFLVVLGVGVGTAKTINLIKEITAETGYTVPLLVKTLGSVALATAGAIILSGDSDWRTTTATALGANGVAQATHALVSQQQARKDRDRMTVRANMPRR